MKYIYKLNLSIRGCISLCKRNIKQNNWTIKETILNEVSMKVVNVHTVSSVLYIKYKEWERIEYSHSSHLDNCLLKKHTEKYNLL